MRTSRLSICRSQAPKALGRSSEPAGPRSQCAVARPRWHPWPDSSKANAIVPHASSDTLVSADGGAGRPASPDDNLLSGRLRGYSSQPVLAPILENQCDGGRQTLQCRRLRAALAIGAGNLRTVSDIPTLVAFHYRRKLVSHTLLCFDAYGGLRASLVSLAKTEATRHF